MRARGLSCARVVFPIVLSTTLVACGSAPVAPTPVPPYPGYGDVIMLSDAPGSGRFVVQMATSSATVYEVTPSMRFTGSVHAFGDMAALYRIGNHLIAGVNGDEVQVKIAGRTPVHDAYPLPIWPRCDGPCPEPGSPDWAGTGILQYEKTMRYVYPWTVFRPEGDYHSMTEIMKASEAGNEVCAVVDGWVVAVVGYQAAKIGAWRTTDGTCPDR